MMTIICIWHIYNLCIWQSSYKYVYVIICQFLLIFFSGEMYTGRIKGDEKEGGEEK